MGERGFVVSLDKDGNDRRVTIKKLTGFHGKSIEVRNPEKFGEIVGLLALGESFSRIAEKCGVDYTTVARVHRDHNKGEIEKWKEKAAEAAELGASMALQRVYEDLNNDEKMDREKLKDKAIVYAILQDKNILLKGEATSRTENVSGVSVEAARKAIEAAQKRIRGEAIDV